MNYEYGKKLTLLGFGLNVLANMLLVLRLFIVSIYTSSDEITYFLAYGQLFSPNSFSILDCTQYISISLAALGFLLMWLVNKDIIDFLSFGATGISALLGLLSSMGIVIPIGRIVFSIILSAFYIVLALRAKNFNIFISLLLVCAFIYQAFSGRFFARYLYGLPIFLIFVWYIGYVICAGICFVEARMED